MKVGSSTLFSILSKTPSQAVESLYENGIKTVEIIFEYPHISFDRNEIDAIKSIDVDLSMHCPFAALSYAHLIPEVRAPTIKLVEKSLKVAEAIGAKEYIMHGGAVPLWYTKPEFVNPKRTEDFLDIFVDELKGIFNSASDAGIKILLENLQSNFLCGKPWHIEYLQNKIDKVGFCFDIAHSELDCLTQELLKFKIDYIHITDNNLQEDEHLAVGKGKIDFKKIFAQIKNKGFDGKIITECLAIDDNINSVKKIKAMLGLK
jgi:sugar phosphate isomerase/epimerase